jgi:hypothetical protein
MAGPILFHEEQRFRQPWLIAVIGLICIVEMGTFGYGMFRQLILKQQWGDHPLPDTALLLIGVSMVAFCIGLIALFLLTRLITEVHNDGLYVRFVPFHPRFLRFSWEFIERWEAVQYNPLLDYGGWGIRYGLKGRAYNVSGNKGVQLQLKDGKRILIGSQRAEALAQAMNKARNG